MRNCISVHGPLETLAKGHSWEPKKRYEKDIESGWGGERGREGGVSWGPNTMFCVVSGSERDVVALHLCTPHLVEIRAILLSRPSATLFFSVSTLSYTVLSLFISLCTPSYEPCRHNLSSRPIRILLDHYHFFHSLVSSTTY